MPPGRAGPPGKGRQARKRHQQPGYIEARAELEARRQARRALLVRLRLEYRWTYARLAAGFGIHIGTVAELLKKAGAGGRREQGVSRIGATIGDFPGPPNPPPRATRAA